MGASRNYVQELSCPHAYDLLHITNSHIMSSYMHLICPICTVSVGFLELNPKSSSVVQVFTAIRDQITGNLTTFSSPKTRAQPGQPWVRGWDDNRKSGGPQVGNQ